METSEYETNTLSINNIASVAFRIYEPPPDQSHGFQSSALEIQSSLRDQGKLVSYDAERVGIWIFQIVSKDGPSNLLNSAPGSSLEASGYTLGMVEEGTLEPVALQKSRIPGNTTQNAPNNAASTSSPAEANGRNPLISPTQVAGGAMPDGGSQSSGQATDMKTPRIVPKIIYEQFIVAVISSIAFAFCSRSMAIPLNYRTMLIPPLQADANERNRGLSQADPVVGTFKTYLTTTGSLIVSLTFSYCKNLATVEDVLTGDSSSPSSSVLAAPYGVFATKQNFANGDGSDRSLAQTPNTQALSVRSVPDTNDSQWKHSCLRALEYCGLNPSHFKSSPWVNLLISKPTSQDADGESKRSRATVPWPGSLCFRKKPLEMSTTHRVGDTILSGHEECHDPLGDARGWFAGASEREERISKRRAERMYAVPKEINGVNPLAQNLNGQSPLTMRRPSTAAAGVMYPTPPDAIQQHIGITTSLDGAISSPNNPPPTLAVVDADITMPTATPMPDAENDAWGGHHEQKRERSDSNAMGDSDDVMNELGEDVFGDHDVTEDDFNFFDGPDGNDLDMHMPDLQPAPPAPAPQVMPPPVLSHPHSHPQPHKAIEPQPEVKPKPKTNDSVFAKPELKHARSSLNEELNHRIKAERPDTAKRGSSPFDPATVFKRVRASLSSPTTDDFAVQPPRRKSSVFEKVEFDPKIPLINKKYEHGGAFDFSKDQSNGDPRPSARSLSRDEYLEGQGKLKQTSKSLLGNSLIRSLTGIDASTTNASPQRLNGHGWISEESDPESDGDDISSLSGGPVSPVKSSIKRTAVDDDALSQATTSRETEVLDDFTDEQLAIELPKLSKTESPEMLLHRFFLDPEPLNVDVGLSNHDFVEIAQIITEQAATGRLEIGIEHKAESSVSLATMRSHELNIARNSLQLLHDVMPSNLGTPTAVRLKGLLEIQDLPLVGQPSRLQPRPIPGRDPNAEQLRANNLYQIPVPHLEVRRSETKLSVLPSSMSFWEGLGLSPSWGTKDISALCIFPGWKGMSDHVESFLGRLKSVYESLKLGTLNNLPLSGDWDDGVLPYEVDRISTSPDATITGHGSALVESMEVLRSSLSELKSKDKNLVIYFVYSPDNPASIIEACTAFYRCFDEYSDLLAARRESPQNELVLQLVSLDMISSTTSLVVPTPAEMIKLCIETYDRCTLFLDTEFGGPTPAPAVMLEQPPPRMIDFKLTTSPSQSLMHENSCLHVGYAESLDGRWITAAWTDNRGQRQATTSYSITRSRTPDRSVSQHKAAIIAEIWATTLTMISIWKVHWRVIITKSGAMDQREVEWWQAASTLDDKHSFTMIIMSVDTNPSLQLVPPIVKIPHAATSAFYSTPVSTPQANIVSPEQTATPATPMRDASTLAATPTAEGAAEAEADSFLIDATDQTWGAIVGHRLCNSTTLLEVRPALASGYLIKRTGTKLEDPPAVMEVNLVHTEATPRAYEPLLREMLCYFRGLGTLARARGVVDREIDVRPWHIAAAEKGVRALHLLL
ncbi:mediator of RNA polymerase II transcription subunit 13 [Fusarium sp. NRRL 52700]|nr:mediator of RNA polymerase II transcription subunit 13 [Fusarium sp. NRRL 52700]